MITKYSVTYYHRFCIFHNVNANLKWHQIKELETFEMIKKQEMLVVPPHPGYQYNYSQSQ